MSNAFQQELAEEVGRAADTLADAKRVLEIAEARYTLAETKFVAVRDLAVEHYGWHVFDLPSMSAYTNMRFIGTTPGEASIAVLRGQGEPCSLDEIIFVLQGGGADFSPRAVNAALLQTKGIKRNPENGKYYLIDG